MITTKIDFFVDYLSQHEEGLTYHQICKEIGVQMVVLERWIELLEEHNVIVVQVKGISERVYPKARPTVNPVTASEVSVPVDVQELDKKVIQHKKILKQKLMRKGYDKKEVEEMWKGIVHKNYYDDLKKQFIHIGLQKGYKAQKLRTYWSKYYNDVVRM